jgi:hypothetical protein
VEGEKSSWQLSMCKEGGRRSAAAKAVMKDTKSLELQAKSRSFWADTSAICKILCLEWATVRVYLVKVYQYDGPAGFPFSSGAVEGQSRMYYYLGTIGTEARTTEARVYDLFLLTYLISYLFYLRSQLVRLVERHPCSRP